MRRAAALGVKPSPRRSRALTRIEQANLPHIAVGEGEARPVRYLYRSKVEKLAEALERDDTRLEASEMLRGLIDSIVLT
jgi:hypothetical protein